ncbi:MAG: hypothetical protein A3G93_00885 [Nitrospinae bacterium RIFCSPLOWO2_12_FULL_45_22]|nr:MAG: hypothetical protein A3G93_00885 [Nitrospinae bacterium RIFCSPLOWO2_12_FULL_45_22]
MPSVREFIKRLREMGELVEIEEEVDWNLEAAAFSTMSCRVGGPILWFKKIKGYPEGYTLLGEPWAGPVHQIWRRLAIAAGAPPEANPFDLGAELLRRLYTGIPPTIVSNGLCKEHIQMGKEANLLKFPWPYLHHGDGGRYTTTGCWCMEDPEERWNNWANYRGMIHTRNGIGYDPTYGQQGDIIMKKWHARGEPMPVAYYVGADVLTFVGAAFRAPWGIWEAELIGGLRQEPLELVKCETNNLYVPADADIVIEGVIRPGELWDEGPFGEYPGFIQGPRMPRPVVRVTAITHRKDPIIPFCVEGMFANSSKALGFAFGVEMWRRLRVYHDLPVVTAWGSPLGSSTWANLWISILKNSPDVVGRAALAFQGSIPGLFRSFIVDATVNPSNTEDGMEEFSLNVHPGRDIRKINAPAAHAIKYEPFLSIAEKKEALKKTVYFDCTSKLPNKRVDFERAFPREVQDWVERNWQGLGFEKPVSITQEKRGEYVMRPVFKSMVD